MPPAKFRAAKSNPPLGERISWPLSFAYHRVSPTLFLVGLISVALWGVWHSARNHDWGLAAEGGIGAAFGCATFRYIRAPHDLWLCGNTLVFVRGEDRVEVRLDNVTAVHVPARSWFARVVSIYWMDDAGIERRIKTAVVASSSEWRALFQRIVDRVPPVQVSTD